MEDKVKLGDKVKDKLTKFTGIVTGRAEYLFGCVQLLVNPGVVKDGEPVAATWVDENRMVLVKSKAVDVSLTPQQAGVTGGPSRKEIPTRRQ